MQQQVFGARLAQLLVRQVIRLLKLADRAQDLVSAEYKRLVEPIAIQLELEQHMAAAVASYFRPSSLEQSLQFQP